MQDHSLSQASYQINVYIDGFNLYYGALKGTPYKWLNFHALCRRILQPHNTLVQIKYFTARVKDRPGRSGQPATSRPEP